MKKTSVALISTALLISVLTGCSKSGTTDTKKDATATGTSTSTATSTDAASTSTTGAAGTSTASADGAKTDATKSGDTNPAVPGQIKISLNELPDDLVICTVAGSPIKVADYRRMLKLQQAQMQLQITNDPVFRQSLAIQAKSAKVALTPEEREKLISTAKAQHTDFQAFLKEKNLTEKQFDDEVEQAGIEFKMANAQLESNLLPQLVSRELMAQASQKAGLEKAADGKYKLVKDSKDFQALKTSTGLSDQSLHDELLKGELAKMQIEKLAKNVKVSDKEIKQWYDANKNQLKHAERIRLSSILVIAPEQDAGPIQSVRTQVQKANPKLEGKDLDALVAKIMMEQQNKALILLGEAQAPKTDFAQLANQNTQDPGARQLKKGGDMGWQEKGQLVPAFADAVWTLKPGTVLPKLVKTAEGYRIIKVTGHETAGPLPLADVHDVIALKLKQDKLNRDLQTWVASEQKKTQIQFSQKFLAVASDKSKTH